MELRNVGNAQTGRLQMFGFRYTSWALTFVDGVKGTLCQDEQNQQYFVDTGPHRAYYLSREACIKAVYYWEKETRLISDGKR